MDMLSHVATSELHNAWEHQMRQAVCVSSGKHLLYKTVNPAH